MTISKQTSFWYFFNLTNLPNFFNSINLLNILPNVFSYEKSFLILAIRESYRNELKELSEKSKLDESSCKFLFKKTKYILKCSEQECREIWNKKPSTKNCRETDFFLVKINLDSSVSSIDFMNKAKSLIALQEAFSQLVGNATVEDISEAVDPEIIDRYFTKVG